MAFPEIDTTRPLGTQMVSTIDDAERETRRWLKQCMEEISGYPDVSTVTVKGWTTSSRPSSNPNGKYLLGYNLDTNSLELIGTDGETIEVLSNDTKKSIALLAHPVGEYYWTSNTSFDPNTEWGGTWQRVQDGRVLIANDSKHAVGSTGGAETVKITASNLPEMKHTHKHDRGNMNITGWIRGENETYSTGGAFSCSGAGNANQSEGNNGNKNNLDFDASRSWTGYTSEDTFTFGKKTPDAINNMQPYRAAVCWHRTA